MSIAAVFCYRGAVEHEGCSSSSNEWIHAIHQTTLTWLYLVGANIAGFVRVVNAMMDQGLV